ncbi:AMP-binding protein [Zoogloea sp.]|uniref:AMP-binding protein n=1 Tax=Zoogloea sp. TaxID=49181 RepID=UPI00345B56B2
MNLARILAARRGPSRAPALLVGAKCVLTCAALAARGATGRLPARQNLGLAPGDRVAIYMGNSPEYLESLFGVLWAGLAVVPVNQAASPRRWRGSSATPGPPGVRVARSWPGAGRGAGRGRPHRAPC